MLCITGRFVAAGLSKFYAFSVHYGMFNLYANVYSKSTHHHHWGLREAYGYDARLEYDSDVKSRRTCSLLTFVMARFV